MKNFYWDDISKYRNGIMGIAIILIMIYHAPWFIAHNSIFNIVRNRGFVGVDIFLFVSGFGLYYSALKKEKIFLFYKKRFIRIFPTFFIVVSISSLFLNDHIGTYLIKISTIGYWINKSFYAWYISLIVLLYLLFPLIIFYFNKSKIKFEILLDICCFILAFLFYNNKNINISPLFDRMPIFVFGIHAADLAHSKYNISMFSFIFIVIMTTILSVVITTIGNDYFTHYKSLFNAISNLFLTISICLILCKILSFIKKSFIYKFISFSGLMSLELYLVHGQGYFNNISILDGFGINRNWGVIIMIAICYIFSLIIHNCVNRKYK